MRIEVRREILTERSTIGDLYLDGQFQCHTLEDKVRPPGVKIPGQTAIPAGTYDLTINYSDRFKRRMPLLIKVPMFEGVRIHSGNTDADTEGCILVGLAEGRDWIGESRVAFDALFPKLLDAYERGEEITISVLDPIAPDLGGEISV
jgi:hypothetical protein